MPSKRIPLTSRTDLFYKKVATETTSLIPIEQIKPDPEQPRKHFSEERLKDLANSIKEKGIIQPIIVRRHKNKYIIIAGERRYRASKIAELKKIPCIVKEVKDYNDIKEIQIIENLQREDISQIERARALKTYIVGKLSISEEEVIKRLDSYRNKVLKGTEKEKIAHIVKTVGKSAYTLKRWLLLLKLPEDVQKKVDSPDSLLTARHVEKLATLNDENLIRQVVKLIEENKLSSEETKKVIKNLKKGKTADVFEKGLKSLQRSISSLNKTISIEHISIEAKKRQAVVEQLNELEELIKKLKKKVM